MKFVVKNFGASFPEERGAAKFHQKFHGLFHGNFHARSQEKSSRQRFCTPCRDEICGLVGSPSLEVLKLYVLSFVFLVMFSSFLLLTFHLCFGEGYLCFVLVLHLFRKAPPVTHLTLDSCDSLLVFYCGGCEMDKCAQPTWDEVTKYLVSFFLSLSLSVCLSFSLSLFGSLCLYLSYMILCVYIYTSLSLLLYRPSLVVQEQVCLVTAENEPSVYNPGIHCNCSALQKTT